MIRYCNYCCTIGSSNRVVQGSIIEHAIEGYLQHFCRVIILIILIAGNRTNLESIIS